MERSVKRARLTGERQSKSEQTREEILLAASKLFREQGYNATTMRQIAEAASVEAGSIYYHFKSKDQILDEILEIGVLQLYDEVEMTIAQARVHGRSFRETFSQLVDSHLNSLLTKSNFTSANIRNYPLLSEKRRLRHRPLREGYAKLWRSFLQQAKESGDLRQDISVVLLSQFILGAMNWTTEWYDASRYSVSMLSERLSKLVLDGMWSEGAAVVNFAVDSSNIPTSDDVDEGGKAERTRQAILTAAAAILRERGYAAATMRRVAMKAGLEAGSVYYHFGSKADILDEVLDMGLRDLLKGVNYAIASCPNNNDYRQRIAVAIAAHMMFVFRDSVFTSANIRIYGMLPEEVRARHRPIRHKYANVWDQMLRDAQKSGGLRSDIKVVPLRQFLLGALNWTIEWFDPERGGKRGYYRLSDFTEQLIKMFLDGISTDASRTKRR